MDKRTKNWLKRNVPTNWMKLFLLLKIHLNRCPKDKKLVINNSRLLVLGNGPSLNGSVEKYIDKLKDYDRMAVNQFAMSDLYEMVRPQYYVLADPEYFKDQPVDYVYGLVSAIKKKTKWRLTIFISEWAKDAHLVNALKNIPNIRFIFYSKNGVPYEWFQNKELFKLLDHGMIAPPSQTVLNTCVSLGIYYRYKKIFIIGADTSWHEQFIVDQITNDVYIEDRHFYGSKKRLYKKHKKNKTNMGEEFLAISKAFSSYQFLQEYAKNNQVNIYNSSDFSWIDVFDRKDLE